MKILLDECTPYVVKKRLSHRNIWTVQETGWSGIKNGDLLAAAEGQSDVFITTDKNLQYQQDLTQRGFAIVLLPSNQVPVVEKLIQPLKPHYKLSKRATLWRFLFLQTVRSFPRAQSATLKSRRTIFAGSEGE